MKALSPGARALFDAGQRSLQPTAEDRERVLRWLTGRIDGLDGDGGDTASVSAGVRGVGWYALGALVIGVAIGGAALVSLVPHDGPRAATPAPSGKSAAIMPTPAPSESPSAEVQEVLAAGEALPTGTLESQRSAKHPSGSVQPSDRLAEEVALLSRAEQDLHAGQFGPALELLTEHQRKFPRGILAEERIAAQVQALCGLGRVSEAERALARLSPKSPQRDPARTACAATHDE